jgi:bifunctional non-homologous end joining protein LigD
MAAQLIAKIPEGTDWIYEVKWDGYRVEAIKEGANVRLLSRKSKNLSADYPEICTALAKLKTHGAVIDGEVVALDDRGRPSFQDLQNRRSARNAHIVYYAFDLLNLNGDSLLNEPIESRKSKLAALLKGSEVLFSANLPGTSYEVVAAIKKLGLEGIVAKRRNSRYEPGRRSGAWIKLHFKKRQEFVIGGFKLDGRRLRSIAVGYYDHKRLMFAGKVRGGFEQFNRSRLLQALLEVGATKCPFANLPASRTGHWGEGITTEEMSEIHWVKPKLVAQVKFTEWTKDGLLRHADYLGLRDDKEPHDVIRETEQV